MDEKMVEAVAKAICEYHGLCIDNQWSFSMEARVAIAAAEPFIMEKAAREIDELRKRLAWAIEETMWSAYNTGIEKNGEWDHICMSDGEWLAASLGLDPSQRIYNAEAIRNAIPAAAIRASIGKE